MIESIHDENSVDTMVVGDRTSLLPNRTKTEPSEMLPNRTERTEPNRKNRTELKKVTFYNSDS